MSKKLRMFFEFRIPLISYVLLGIIIAILFFTGHQFYPLSVITSQIGCILVVFGLLIRILASVTTKYLGKIKITGVYAICRQPMLLAQFFIIIGFNFIVLNPIFFVSSLIIFFANDVLAMTKYDSILEHYYREIWQIYKSQTRFVLPFTKRIKDVFSKSLSVNELDNSSNTFIFIAIYALLVEIAMFSSI